MTSIRTYQEKIRLRIKDETGNNQGYRKKLRG
jgi:hypothetical protein